MQDLFYIFSKFLKQVSLQGERNDTFTVRFFLEINKSFEGMDENIAVFSLGAPHKIDLER